MNTIKHSAPARASQPPITRRQALRALGQGAAAGAAVALPIAATAAAEPSPDAELLRLGAELEAAWAFERAYFADPESDMSDAACNAVTDVASALVASMIPIGATTLEGLIVKGRALLWCYGDDAVFEKSLREGRFRLPTNRLVNYSILRDLARLHENAHA